MVLDKDHARVVQSGHPRTQAAHTASQRVRMISALDLDVLPLLSSAHLAPAESLVVPLLGRSPSGFPVKEACPCQAGRDRKGRTRSADLSVAPTLSGLSGSLDRFVRRPDRSAIVTCHRVPSVRALCLADSGGGARPVTPISLMEKDWQ